MQQGARNACAPIATLFQRYCWIGWTAWAIFVVIALVNLATDAVLKPAIVTAISVWLAWLMAAPGRWRALVEGDQPQRSGAGAMAGAVAGTGHH